MTTNTKPQQSKAESQPDTKKTPLQIFVHWLPFYIMGLPGLLYLFINNYIPLAGLQIAFKEFSYSKGMWASSWNNFANFKFLFASSDAFIMIRNTILYNVCWIALGMVLGVAAAILVNEVIGKIKQQFYMTVILLPYLMSAVIVAYLVYAYLSPTSGLFTKALESLTGKAPAFYQETIWWPFILTFVNQWKGIGFGMILYLSSILGIDPSLYEAATLDGATRWQQHKNITIPLLKPMLIMMFILNLGQIFRSDFGLFYQVPMSQGALFPVTQTIDTYVYRALLKSNNVGMSSAASFLQSVVGFIFIVGANKIVSKFDKSSSLF